MTNRSLVRRFLEALGPGLITGAADDDPSGIATYSQAGAQFGYSLVWTVVLTLPFMAAIQIVSACVGWRTRHGLARNLSHVLPKPALYALISLLLFANVLNIAADLAAMGDALRLVLGGPALLYVMVFGVGSLVVEILIPYHRYAGYLKFLTLVLLLYVATAFSVEVPWGTVIFSSLVPHASWDRDQILMIVAIFGTTISPYLFFWQASQEAEESRLSVAHHLRHRRAHPVNYASRISADTWIGMAFSNAVAFFIIVTTAATLNAHGITEIASASQAAEALRPVAGALAFTLFAAGIIGTGLLAVPVLAGSAAYAVAETMKMPGSLELPARRAVGFYTVIGIATIAGGLLAILNLDPIAMLFWAAVVNGIVAVPIMFATMAIVAGPRARKVFGLPRWTEPTGWLAAALMTLAAAALGWLSFVGTN